MSVVVMPAHENRPDLSAVLAAFVRAPNLRTERSLRVLARDVSAAAGASGYTFLIRRGASLHLAGMDGTGGEAVDTSEARRYWRLASRRRVIHAQGSDLLVPLRRHSSDALTAEWLEGLIVLHRGDGDPPFDNEDRRFASLAGQLFLEHYELVQERLRSSATRRVARQANNLHFTRDVAYQIAKEIRHYTRYDGQCVILRWVPQTGRLQQLAKLSAGGKRQSASPSPDSIDDDRRAIVSWDAGAATELLADWRSYVLVAGDERWRNGTQSKVYGYSSRGFEPIEHDGITTLLAILCEELDSAGLALGRTRVITPLVRNRTLLGLQLVSAAAPSAFSERDVIDSTRLADYMLPGLLRDLQIETELADLKDQASLQEDAFTSDRPVPQANSLRSLLHVFCERVRRHLAADQVVIIPYDYRQNSLNADLVVAASDDLAAPPVADEPPGGTTAVVLGTDEGELEWHDQEGRSPAVGRYAREAGIRSFYAVVLSAPDRTTSATAAPPEPFGLFFVNYRTLKGVRTDDTDAPPRFSSLDKETIRFFATVASSYLGTYVRTLERYAVESASQELYRLVSERELNLRPDLVTAVQEVLDLVLTTAIRLVKGTAGAIAIPCNQHRDLVFSAHHNLATHAAHIPYGYEGGVTGQCAARLEPIIVEESSNPPPGIAPLPFVPGSRSEVAVPLISGTGRDRRLLGVLDVESQIVERAFRGVEVAILERLAGAAVITLGLASHLGQLRSLKAVGDQIDKADNAEEVFRTLLREARATTGAFAASARLIDPSERFLDPVHHDGEPGDYLYESIPVDAGVNGWVFRKQRHCIISDVTARDAVQAAYPELKVLPSRTGTRSELCVPISWRGDRIGVLNLEHVQVGVFLPFVDYVQTLAAGAAYVLWQLRSRQRDVRLRDQELVTGVTQFASSIAHDVKKYFVRIELAAKRLGNPAEFDNALGAILTEAARGREEAQTLLEHATDPVVRKVYEDIVLLVHDVVTDFRQSCPEDDVLLEMETSIPYGTQVVFCKKRLFAWAIKQILSNSAAYGRRRREGAPVRIAVHVRMFRRGMAEVEIADQGALIPQAVVKEMFDYEKTDSTPKGSGRSLALVRSHIVAMGGTIDASALPEGGLKTIIRMTVEPLETNEGEADLWEGGKSVK